MEVKQNYTLVLIITNKMISSNTKKSLIQPMMTKLNINQYYWSILRSYDCNGRRSVLRDLWGPK